MLEVQAISTEHGKLYSAMAENYNEATYWAGRFLGYNGIDTIKIMNLRKIEKINSKRKGN